MPAEIARRQEGKTQLTKARTEIQARAQARNALANAGYEGEKYKLRQQTVEPVFGIIKSVLGFRRFMLRELGKVTLEWILVSRPTI